MTALPSRENATVDISEPVEMAAARLWEAQHEHDSITRGRAWETAQQIEPVGIGREYVQDIARTRWVCETVLAESWDWLRDYFYAEYEEAQSVA